MKTKKIVFGVLISIITFVIVALLLFPTLAKNYVIKHSKELVGRQVQFEKLKLNYFTGTFKIVDFKMFEQNETDIFVSFDTLLIDLEPYKLFSDEFVMEQFYLKSLHVNTILKDSTFNFDDLIAFHSSTDTISNEETTPFKYSLSNIQFKDANFNFDNRELNHITEINELSFLVPFIGWDQNDNSEAGIKFNLKKGGFVESSLKADPKSGDFEAHVTLHSLYLEPFLKYVQEYAKISYVNGQVDANILIKGNFNEAANAIVSGNAQVYDFIMNDLQNKKFLGSKKINCVLKEIDYTNSKYVIDSLNFEEPYVFFKLDSVSNNLFDIFDYSLDEEETSTDDPLYYAINHLSVDKGVTDYTDNLTGNPFNYYLSEITIDSDSILSDSDWVTIYSTMLLNKRGTLKAATGFNPLDPMNLAVDISIEKFKLSDINIYTNYYMGHTILKGDMFYYSKSTITNGNIVSENKLLIKNPTLNNTKKGIYSLPLKFALFVLTDKNGEVNLDIPVRGNLNDPSINMRKIIWTTFKNLIVKIATSPGRLLANLVNGKAEDIEEISFNYLDTIPSEKNKKQLDMLLDLEQKKEELTIDMTYYVDPTLQKEAIAKAIAGKHYFNETQKDYLKDENGFEKYVLQKSLPDTLTVEKAILKIATPTLVDSIAVSTNQLLLNNLKNYLQTQQNETNIKVEVSNPEAPENTGSRPRLKVKFSMKED
jgi:hypothetical protein